MSGLPRRRILGLLGGGAAGLFASPARADPALDVRILQTASSLEALAGAAWARVTAGPLAGFAAGAGGRHAERRRALQDRTAELGGRIQDAPNPRFAPLLGSADPVAAATTAEAVLVDTYLSNLTVLEDRRSRELVAGAMALAAQHLAVARLAGTHPVRIPLPQSDLATVPAAAGTVAPPTGLHPLGGPELVADPASGVPA